MLTLQIEILHNSERIDQALLRLLKNQGLPISRQKLKSCFQEQKVHYKGRPIKPSVFLPLGLHEVQIDEDLSQMEAKPQAALADSSFTQAVVYEDSHLLVLHKESGRPSLPLNSEENKTAVNFVLRRVPEISQVGRKGLEPGLLHRLDTETSGLLVFAKTESTFEHLNSAWKNHGIRKIYRALVKPSQPLGSFPCVINTPLGHDKSSSKRMIALLENKKILERQIRGKPLPAVTRVNRVFSQTQELADLEIEIETGVMHQIRCHLSSRGWPIWGDPIYHPGESYHLPSPTTPRLWLHAWRLYLPLADGTGIWLEAELPWRQ